MRFDPVMTFLIYLVAMTTIFALCAIAADLLSAKAERDARRQARAEARAELLKEREQSRVEWR